MKETHIFKLPHLGEGVDSAEISEILVSPNDKTNNNTPILIATRKYRYFCHCTVILQ